MKSLLLRIFSASVIVSMFLVSCSPPLPVVPVVSVTPQPSATSAAPQSDAVWDRIVANNKIVVGTSWDYPPFSSVDPNFQVVGFDIALVEEIGRRLQIPVEIQNYTFEGLSGALQLNQIDLAVAAISITPERTSQMSFSPIYYVNETAILVRSDSLITNITDFTQLAGLRVGAQRGTTPVLSDFDAVWTVSNISGNNWRTDSVDYKFISGTKMHKKDGYDFAQTINNGESGEIIVDMIAPGEPGVYGSTWAIVSGNRTLCVLNMTVTVTAK